LIFSWMDSAARNNPGPMMLHRSGGLPAVWHASNNEKAEVPGCSAFAHG
jgi:hypothetical protein